MNGAIWADAPARRTYDQEVGGDRGVRQRGHPTAPSDRPPFWSRSEADLAAQIDASIGSGEGLSQDDAARRLDRDGPNRIGGHAHATGLRLLLNQFASPIIGILAAATVLSMLLGDMLDGTIILAIIAASGLLGFWQEHTAGRAVEALMASVRVHADVIRDDKETEVPIAEIVVGDLLVLRAGDIVAADARILESHNLLVDEAALTGESYPVEKTTGTVDANAPIADRTNAVFFGTHVVSGSAHALVAATGARTEFGALGLDLASKDVTTSFERGTTQFGMLLVRAMVVLVAAIFILNLALHRSVVESVLFSLALAVGITPQLLPAIVAVCLAHGARRMAQEKVIVRRLDAIEDFGSLTVLCTVKTGTLTAGTARLHACVDAAGKQSEELLELARLNAGLQQGFANPMDGAILDGAAPIDASKRLDEVPYDFSRRLLSVLVDGRPPMLVTKGAVPNVLAACTRVAANGSSQDLTSLRDRLDDMVSTFSADGFRVVALATREMPGASSVTADDESGMTLRGLLLFADPAKPDARESVQELHQLGVSVRLITGDNRLAAEHIARDVGLATEQILTGSDIAGLDDVALQRHAADVEVFAEIEPLQKERIVHAIRASGHTVGYLGDGINDAAALKAADVGISVDSAVDVAKNAAAIVLLDKSLAVIGDGIRMGRATFVNTLKYIRVTASANLGNVISMAVAAVALPFLPLLPRQILLLNFVSDIPGTTIATDNVDDELLDAPRRWDVRGIARFMLVFGLASTLIDLTTFAVLRIGFDADADLFRSSWFVVSMMTELTAMLVLRTARPAWRSRPSRPLLLTSAVVAVATVVLPYSPLAGPLGLVAVPAVLLIALAGLTVLYILVNEALKHWTSLARM